MFKKIHLLCGIPASGKSTWARKYVEVANNKNINATIVSRDEIRKKLVGEDANADLYFSREKEVFSQFIESINASIADPTTDEIIIDATHLNKISRDKVLNQINGNKDIELIIECFPIDRNIAMLRNNERTGFAKVPPHAIYNMSLVWAEPTLNDFENFVNIYKKIIITTHYQKR